MYASVTTAQIRPGKMEECLDKWQEKVCKKAVMVDGQEAEACSCLG